MSAIRNDKSAFPHDSGLHNTGMELRDYFAAKALPAIIDKFRNPEAADFDELFELVAVMAYAQSDAMMKARAL